MRRRKVTRGDPQCRWDAIGNSSVVGLGAVIGQDGSYGGVYARKFDWSGKPLSGEFLVNTTTSGSQDIACRGGGSATPWSFCYRLAGTG